MQEPPQNVNPAQPVKDSSVRQSKVVDSETPKTLTNTSVAEVKVKVPDVKVVGNGDSFKVLFKASSESEGWMKSTKALELPQGCLVQVTTQQRNGDGTYSLAEALTFAPGVRIADDVNGGRKLVNIY